MAENKEYITQQENTGSILISEDVVASIATAAALETEGVSAMLSAAGGDLKPSRKMSAKGVVIEPEDDGLRITPGTALPAAIDTYDDHRMAMSFALAGLRIPGVLINNPACVSKTFPDFFQRFAALR